MPNVLPPPSDNSRWWSGPNWNTTVLLDTTIARLRAIDSMPSVTTNGGKPMKAISTPLKAPTATPVSKRNEDTDLEAVARMHRDRERHARKTQYRAHAEGRCRR